MSEIKVDKLSPETGTAVTLGDSGDTFTVPSGATIVNSGTATGFGGGKIGQMVSTQLDVLQSTTSTSQVAITGVTGAITPSATSSKIWVQGHLNWGFGTDNSLFFQMFRDSTLINDQDFSSADANTMYASGAGGVYSVMRTASFSFLDSPSSTSELTYTAKWRVDGNTVYLNRVGSTDGKAGTSQWNLLEVLA